MKKVLLIISLVVAALLLFPSSIAGSMGVKPGPGGPGTGTRPSAAAPCRPRTNLKNCIPKPPKKCNHPFQKDCP
ncbi:myomegalin-like protein [Corchorus capsularis]|uniref:Myomegalin-like protein n=1 Tax=Corchorus capsularis TaxID=210143 RepID=A0A1R3IBS9_COCAP|nr:myomegalin-like protein [Corchorus capsularis]